MSSHPKTHCCSCQAHQSDPSTVSAGGDSHNEHQDAHSSSSRTSSEAVLSNGHKDAEFAGFSENPSLEGIRQLQAEFVNERNWNQYHSPRNILLALVGEVGELAELFQWKGEVQEGLPDFTSKERKNVEDELSDVMIYLARLADKCHVDLPAAVLRKMEQNRRKYPVDKVYGSSKKYTEYKQDSL